MTTVPPGAHLSNFGRPTAEAAGFTLLEITVAMLILGVLGAVAAGSTGRGVSGVRLKTAARTAVADLARARDLAVFRGRPVLFQLDVDAGSYRVGNAAPVALPAGTAVRIVTAGRDVIDAGTGAIRFWPDGGSDGGEIRLGEAGQYRIDVDWLTGHVSLSR